MVGNDLASRGAIAVCIALCAALAMLPAGAAAEPPPDSVTWMYDPGKVVVIDLTLSPEEKAALEGEPDEYVKGTFSLATTDGTPGGEEIPVGTPLAEVGIRLKGGQGSSFRPLSGKAAFKLKFNKFVKGQKFLGLKKMTLNNMVEDFSLIHETLAYTAFRAAGIPASRTGFADVRLNGEDYGLHLNIEDLDDVFLERWFGEFDDPQHLYEGEDGADVVPGGAGEYEVDEGDEEDLSDLEALIAAVNSVEGEGWSTAVSPVADLPELTRMWAVEKYTGQWDGYSGQEGQFQPNNYFLYSDASGVFQMLPWGTDETFQRRIPFDGPAGLMFNLCLADPSCEALYRRELRAVGTLIAALGLTSLGESTAQILKPWEEADPRLEHPELVDEAVAKTLAFIEERPAELAAWLGPEEEAEEEPAPEEEPAQPPEAEGGPVLGQQPIDPVLPTANATSAPVPGPRLHVLLLHAGPGALVTHLRLTTGGHVRQTASIETASGSIRACVAQESAIAAGPLKLSCSLSEAVRRRLRARWLKLEVRTTFTSPRGEEESVTSQIRLPRSIAR